MELLRIRGGRRLEGNVAISGSKNAALPVMAASLLTDEQVELGHVPDIEDISTRAGMLEHVGVAIEHPDSHAWRLHAAQLRTTEVDADLSQRMRGSFLLLGALVARAGEASIAKPGGHDIGMRRVEQHLEGLRLMVAEVEERDGAYFARARRLHGARIALDMPTVTGTENLMMAAVLAEGITVISNAAREPHVYDLARCLIGMGAHITGVGTELIVIEGSGGLLHGTTHNVTADYIEAGTYMIAAAATYGDVVVDQMRPSDLRWLFSKLRSAGCDIVEGAHHVRVSCSHLRGVDMTTWPHPGFATDMQPQFCALMTQATGASVISEALYENRFRHVAFLQQMGARIAIDGRSAVINGPARLHGTRMSIPDIRSGAALALVALCADGTTELDNVFHLERGYDDLEMKLAGLGADIERLTTDEPGTEVRDLTGVVGD